MAILLLSLNHPLAADEIRTLGGKNLNGTLTAITPNDITLKTDIGPVTIPLSQVLAVNFRAAKPIDPSTQFSDVRLLDDTVLHCRAAQFRGDQVELTLLSGAAFKLPLNFVVSYVRDAHNAVLARKFENLASKRLKRDRIVIVRDNEMNVLEGTLGGIDPKGQSVSFKPESSGAQVELPFERLHGMIFYRTEVPAETPLCKVFDTEGNSLVALTLTADGTSLNLSTTFGAKLALPLEAVARLDFNMGKLTFLSDMEPARVVEKSGIGLIVRYRRDANLDGEPILLDKTYTKGLSLHAHTELEYNLAGKYKEFKAVLGVDARTGSDSQARVAIYCDGVEQFARVVTPKDIVPVAINVKDITTLRIVVSSRNFLDLHDHATLAEARVSQ